MSKKTPSIFLAGFMGTGKTTVGRQLAVLLGRQFVDLDDRIAAGAGRPVPEIFAREGEAGFRRRERAAVAELACRPGLVVATGGGTLLDPDNRARLRNSGPVCLLTASLDELVSRLGDGGDRPLLRGAGDLRGRLAELLAVRADAYRGCDLELDTTGLEPSASAQRLASSLPLPSTRIELEVVGADGQPALAARGRSASRLVAGRGASCRLGAELRDVGVDDRIVMMAPEVVRDLYEPLLTGSLAAAGLSCEVVSVRDGDREKTFTQAAELVETLAERGADRQTCILAAGGGVTCDLAGFVAAIYMRGTAVVMLPTTLLAQVDAAIGGKTGVNGRLAKNLAGAFHPPLLVLSDPCLLASLPERELAGGYAEVVKTAMIGDRDLFARLERELVMRGTPAGRQSGSASGPAPAPGGTADPRRDPELLQACVAGCMRVKGGLVGRDPWDLGDRQLLNLGHTLGHALEAESGFGLSHGEAVSLGLLAAIRLAIGRGLAGGELLGRTRRLLSACGLPIRAPAYEPEELRARLGLDKKRTAGRLRFILPAGIGRVAAVDDVGEDEALASLQEVSRCASS